MVTQLSRRRWLETCATVAGTTVIAGCSGSDENGDREAEHGDSDGDESSSSDWPMYGVDLQNTGHHPDATGPAGDEVIERKVIDTEMTGLYPITIADGMLYGTNAGQSIYALNLETEEIKWEGNVGGSTIFHDEMIYGPVSDETLYGYDTGSGDQWESEQNNSVSAFVTQPIPTSDGIFIASDDAIWRFDLDTGESTKVIDTPLANVTTEWPAFDDKTLYIGRSAGLHAINVDTPEIEWTFEPDNGGSVAASNPVVVDGTVYVVNTEERLHAIDTDTGEEEWAVDVDIAGGSPAVAEGMVYLTGPRSVVAVDINSGSIEWEAGDDVALEPYDAVVASGICYVATSFRMWGYDADFGDLIWKYERPDDSEIRFSASPTVFDDTIYAPSSDDTLYAIEDA